ncbi:Uncharacterised protein family UPF0405 [Phaffia rhodozyma]|uniref:Uncharacterized protein family UPF0405 n=1 Tax=Phaffia rhodozyma TaxID=264483 RepID=A0A0F7SLJ0_PHARH|nr:Uncharacterised protein family UPF0405 [Phaffia rhodozyma]
MTFLTPHLHFTSSSISSSARSPLPPAATTVLLSDTISAPADFVLLHFVATQLKATKSVLLVGCGEGVDHYKAISKKIGISLDQPNFKFHDALSAQSQSSAPSDLRNLFDSIISLVERQQKENSSPSDGPESEVMVVLDDLSALLWMGAELETVGRFVRALQASSRKLNFNIVYLVHTIPSSASAVPEDELFRLLHPSADLWIRVQGLQSGRSGDVSGELSFIPSPLLDSDEGFPRTEPGKELQYKLGDSGVTFFPKGTGQGFL